MRQNFWTEFNKEQHLQPNLDKSEFDTLTSWDFGWFLLEPINIIQDQEEDEIRVTKQYSPAQKALHFFWYLDAQVTNGGFIQFYINDYGKYIPAILEGLAFIGDKEMLDLVKRAEELYVENESRFDSNSPDFPEDGWENIFEDLTDFEELDSRYYAIHEQTMNLIETYARNNPNEFGILK